MQLLFSQNRDERLPDDKIIDLYDQSLKLSFRLYLFHLYVLIQVSSYALKDTEKKHGKYLPKPEDLLFNPKLYKNPCMQSLVENKGLHGKFEYLKFAEFYDEDLNRKAYFEFSKQEEEYHNYVYEDTGLEDDRKMLLSLYKVIIKNELISEMTDDHFANWQDDKSLIVGVMKKTIKALPAEGSFFNDYQPTEDTTVDFGLKLLNNVLEKGEQYGKQIEAILKNWDAERVAVIDMILLKMAAAEFVLFPSIPTKVTINEYMEISKMYSTEKSKDFINGILDRMLKDLEEDGKIDKKGRGLQE